MKTIIGKGTERITRFISFFNFQYSILILLLGMCCGSVQAQVLVEGNVYGGGNMGIVTKSTTVTVNGGTIGKKIPLEKRILDEDGQIVDRIEYGNVYGGGNGNKAIGTNPTNGAPEYDFSGGQVMGNATVTIGGNANVRHAVYGGGNMGTVGTCVVPQNTGVPTSYADGTGEAKVTIGGYAIIGPKVEDLTVSTSDERASAGNVLKDNHESLTETEYIDSAFKFLGENEGWVFGSSRGESGGYLRNLSFVNKSIVTVCDEAKVLNVYGGGENGHVYDKAKVVIKDDVIIGGIPIHGEEYTIPSDNIYYSASHSTINTGENEFYEDKYGVGPQIFRGNVFGGGKGNDYISWFLPAQKKYCYTAGRVYGSTEVTISGNAMIYNRVYGGGTIASVGTFIEEESTDNDNHTIVGIVGNTGHTYVNIEGGVIGSHNSDLNGKSRGEVYGGGLGIPGRKRNLKDKNNPSLGLENLQPLHQVVDEAYVGHTHVTVTGGTIMNCVYGGAANGHVQGNTNVLVQNADPAIPTTIGSLGEGEWHGNVYGGGGGTERYSENDEEAISITAGAVYGNANVTIEGGNIIHSVYGGGAIASVGTYDASELVSPTKPYLANGISTVNVTGGTIGTDGNNNGMVYGSGRGLVDAPNSMLDYVVYVAKSVVNIGKETNTPGAYEGDAKIKGSVYGSGENGHVYLQTTVNVYSGTIGCTYTEYNTWKLDPATYATELANFPYRGNVYGAGCGTDQYDLDKDGTDDTYNPIAGHVQGNTEVNIYGGYISRNVYGGGAMASVGLIDHKKTKSHLINAEGSTESSNFNINHKAAISWPYELTYLSIPDENFNPDADVSETNPLVSTGKATVNIYGGHIGTLSAPIATSGNVFGSARGAVGPLYHLDTLAMVRETEVNVNFSPLLSDPTDETKDVILGSVYGSGEDGFVYEDTRVTVTNGLIVGSVFGGGSGTGTYEVVLKNPAYDKETNPSVDQYLAPKLERSVTAGKVYGNTEVNIVDGWVQHNVFGGGNLASVGKGNYMGYGELADPGDNPPCSTAYLNSGICTVNIYGGTIGTDGIRGAGDVLNGYVFGSSRGTTFELINKNPRYDYSRDFFLAYCNETNVIIGESVGSNSIPRIYGSVFGGGENGHVRWHTNVVINDGEIGVEPTATGYSEDQLKLVGNVYGAGQGTDYIPNTTTYCSSAGSVTLNTNVTVNGGTIHRNVYGGGSNASVGPPPTGYPAGESLNTIKIYGGVIGHRNSATGDVFGAGRGERALLTTNDIGKFATSIATEVHIYGPDAGGSGADIYGNIYGGGEIGQTQENTNVYIHGGRAEGSVYGAGKGDNTDEKAALVKGNATVDMSGGIVERSIYGGGELASVGTITYADEAYHTANPTVAVGTPLCAASTGLTTVSITGGTVGVPAKALMPPPDPDNDNYGYVFAGCQGIGDATPNAEKWALCGNTSLTIGGDALVTASAYGGSENGMVIEDTYVHITGSCQIGVGVVGTTPDDKYTDEQWNAAMYAVEHGTMGTDIYTNPFHECSAWPYHAPYTVYDPDVTKVKLIEGGALELFNMDLYQATGTDADNYRNAIANAKGFYYNDGTDSKGGMPIGTNGNSFYGNVFGGGSGYYPYAPGMWRRSAGAVLGNTNIDIDGGHILTSVYGGNENTDVGTYDNTGLNLLSGGKCTITMSGGTLGVPRSIDDIINHPVTCYLFGAGKGDQRVLFNEWTNVGSVEVNITGGHIFGSAFGGGEDGHVIGDVNLSISDPVEMDDDPDNPQPLAEQVHPFIGTQGLSYVDGNVFGGGRGFSGDALTAGVVCGNIEVNISGGTMLGSVYGGGRLASVGTYLKPEDDDDYGKMQPGEGHGFINVNISGGTIGNKRPYIYVTADDFDDLKDEETGDLRHMTYGAVRVKAGKQTQTNFENILKHTISGNVFGGCMGRITLLDGTVNDKWPDLARCKKTRVNISGDAVIRSSVYGGGEIGIVCDSTTVNILGGTIGTAIKVVEENAETRNTLNTLLGKYSNPTAFAKYFYDTDPNYYDPTLKDDHAFIDALPTSYSCYTRNTNYPHYANNTYPHYYFGSVYGGGYGSDDATPQEDLDVKHCLELTTNHAPSTLAPVDVAGRVFGNTYVNVKGGTVLENVFGGGDLASVGTNIYHETSGAVIGTVPERGICTVKIGNLVADATYALAHDGVNEDDILASPCIGPLDFTGMNANVYAAGRGVAWDQSGTYNPYCNVDSTRLEVSGGRIWGSTFGGGADCHVLGNAGSYIQEGAYIGDKGITEFDGYVFGGGRNYYNSNSAAGRVQGNTYVVMTGGRLMCSIIGGGCMARVGVDVDGDISSLNGNDGNYDSTLHGSTFINVSGNTTMMSPTEYNASPLKDIFYGTTDVDAMGNIVVYHTAIGSGFGPYLLDCDYSIGDIFGGGKGDTRDTLDITAGRVMNSHIKVTGSPRIMADIYAGGEMGCIGWYDITGKNVNKYKANTGYTYVTVGTTDEDKRAYLGTPYEFSTTNFRAGVTWSIIDTSFGASGRLLHTCSGNVYGGGQGFVCDGYTNWPSMGRVRMTHVTINDVRMMGHVFGGGSRGVVTEDTWVKVNGGIIGTEIQDVYPGKIEGHNLPTYYYGSVFGGGYGNPHHDVFETVPDSAVGGNPCVAVGYAGRIYGNTNVEITGGQIMECVFGGGDLASVGFVKEDGSLSNSVCNVTISGDAVIGPLDMTGQNAYVYGGGRGRAADITEFYKDYCNVNYTNLIVNGGKIWGSTFGGCPDAHVLGDVRTTVNAGADLGTRGVTTYDGNIFGGGRNYFNSNHTNGRVEGNIYVTMTGGSIKGSIFGGGRLAMSGVDANGCFNTSAAGFDATKRGNVTIEVSGGTIGTDRSDSLLFANESVGDIFGAGKGDTKNYKDIFAGRVSNVKITISGNPVIKGSVFGGGEMASLGYWDDTIVTHYFRKLQQVDGDGNPMTDGNGNPVYVQELDGNGDPILDDDDNPVYKSEIADKTVNTGSGSSYGVIYESTGSAVISITGTPKIGTPDELTRYTMPSENTSEAERLAQIANGGTENPGAWTMYNDDGTVYHTCTGNVFGGGQGDVDISTPRWVSMGRSRTSTITIGSKEDATAGPTIMGCVFGGGEQGIMTGDANVTIYSGTIGTEVTTGSGATTHYIYGDVYGGGYGSDEQDNEADKYNDTIWTEDDPPVISRIDQLWAVNDSTVYRKDLSTSLSLSGADTLCSKPSAMAGRVFGDTRVDILGGEVKGSVYGGGSFAPVGFEKTTNKGNTLVNIGLETEPSKVDPPCDPEYYGSATIGENVYGCNNYTGTPYGNAVVNIYKTARTAKQIVSYTSADAEFAIANVFGGGHDADYSPNNDITATTSNKRAKVHVWGCQNTIEDLFGGGDAASAYGVVTIVDGGRFDRVFGGGNGEEAQADIGLGGTNLTINGGDIRQVFGGSNMNGTIHGPLQTELAHVCLDCTEEIDEFYAGSNQAAIVGDLTTTIDCGVGTVHRLYGGCREATITGNVELNVYGGTFDYIFGGSRGKAAVAAVDDDPLTPDVDESSLAQDAVSADISGNVTLNLYGGELTYQYNDLSKAAYGGSDILGNIGGGITVNVEQNGGCALNIPIVYGAGNLAPYTPENASASYPEVNIKHTLNNNNLKYVFGGGYGSSAIVTANPVVNIGDDSDEHYVKVSYDVYGGGNLAPVVGNTTVKVVNTHSIVDNSLYGGGNQANVKVATVYGGGYSGNVGGNVDVVIGDVGSAPTITTVYGGGANADVNSSESESDHYHTNVTFNNGTAYKIFGGGQGIENETSANVLGSVKIDLNGGNVYHTTESDCAIYGGCNRNGSVNGNTIVNILGGMIGNTSIRGKGVFGGGLGSSTSVNGDVTVNITRASGDNPPAAPTIYGDIYGGSAQGTVNTNSSNTTTVNILDGSITGDVYGGGLGDASHPAVVNGKVFVNVGSRIETIDNSDPEHPVTTVSYTGDAVFNTYTDNAVTKGGQIFGGNNINGTPMDNIAVNIYKTGHGLTAETNKYPTAPVGGWKQENLETNAAIQAYAIQLTSLLPATRQPRSMYGAARIPSRTSSEAATLPKWVAMQ